MRKCLFIIAVLLPLFNALAQDDWKAKWITALQNQNQTNTWIAFRKVMDVEAVPENAVAKIAADSKYWLWINEELVVFEGALKRGPNPTDTYFDEVDIAPYLKEGKNTVAVLLWYYGKDGFSHNSSGKAALLFDCQAPGVELFSDKSWKSTLLKAFQTAGEPYPNFRLPESNILFDARKDIGFWQGLDYDDKNMGAANEIGKAGSTPWNKLIVRPIPLFKNYGLKDYVNQKRFPLISSGDTIVCDLPYNAQVTPYLKVEAEEGQKIVMFTDNYSKYNGGELNLRAEYITKKGVQEYENLCWMNGHKVYYIIPKGVKVLDLQFRETGYDAEFLGSFTSSDPFLNKLWEKSVRTLYVTMRDSYMDCPDREKAQWTGDAVNESGEAFYALSPSGSALAKKWLYEAIGWQGENGEIFTPVPNGTEKFELPGQALATIGYFGLWNYYLHSGDKQTLADLYDGAKRYLDIWEQDSYGLLKVRQGSWTWGDWGEEKDMLLLYNLWYYIAVKGMNLAAEELGKKDDAASFAAFMKNFKDAFNARFWTGSAYRDPDYQGKTDDRAQALAVVSGIAESDKFPALLKVFQNESHASPYMEKYVFEAMFMMGYENEALERHKKRFGPMVNNPYFTTLFEGWGIGKEGFGGGTVNHAWSGGGLTILSQYLCGIAPITPGYETFQIVPQPGAVEKAGATVTSNKGTIKSSFVNQSKSFVLHAEVPSSTSAWVGIPDKGYTRILMNGKKIWEKGKFMKNKHITASHQERESHILFKVAEGKWKFEAIK